MDSLFRDFRDGWRTLRRTPGAALLAVLCMALGIGSVATVYGTASAYTFRPLPQVRNPGRLAHLWESPVAEPSRVSGVSPAALRDLQALRAFSSVAGVQNGRANIEGADISERVRAARVSASLLRTLGRAPALGRDFTEADEQAGGERVALLGHGLWQRRFGGDTSLVGRTVRIDGEGYRVVGILPEDFVFPLGSQILVPLSLTADEWAVRDQRSILALARFARGVRAERAAAEVVTLGRRLAATYPDASDGWTFNSEGAEEFFGRGPRPFMIVMLATVVFLLLVACASVANLLLVRAAGRRREIGVRVALGASRWRIARQVLAESTLISFAGAALGCVMAVWGLGVSATGVPAEVRQVIPGLANLRLDWRALALAAAAAAASAMLFGLAPALTAARVDVQACLKDGGREEGVRSRMRHLRSALVVVEMALGLQLLVGATLMVDTFRRLSLTDPGFRTTGVLTLAVALPEDGYPSDSLVTRFFEDLQDRVAALPGALTAGVTTLLPMSWGTDRTAVELEGRPLRRPEDAPAVGIRRVSASYAGTLDIGVLRGRGLSRMDGPTAPAVALVSDAAARRLWPGESAVGKRLRARDLVADGQPWIEVVGVVANVRGNPLADNDPLPVLYVPCRQWPSRAMTLVVRSAGDPEGLAPAIRREIAALDSRLAASDVATMPSVVASAVSPQRATAGTLAAAAIIALVLAATGTYGVMAYGAARRTREFGVRIALGATPTGIVRLVLRQSLTLACVGVVLGTVGALAMGRGMRAILYETDPWNPLVIGGAALALGIVALVAGWVPARRALRVSPMETLRAE